MRLAALLFSLAACCVHAAWPEKPIRVLIGYAPGGSTDVVARLLSPKLSEKLGQPIVIENKPGGAGDFAAELMLQAPPDGYTLMMTTVAVHAINPGLMKQKFNPIEDFTPIAMVCSYPMIMIASPSTTFKSPAELKEAAAKTPIFYARPAWARRATCRASCCAEHQRQHHARPLQGRRALGRWRSCRARRRSTSPRCPRWSRRSAAARCARSALASRERNPAVPDVPTLIEQGSAGFRGRHVERSHRPTRRARRHSQEDQRRGGRGVNDPAIRKRLVDEGAEIRLMSPQEVRRLHARRERALGEGGQGRGDHAAIDAAGSHPRARPARDRARTARQGSTSPAISWS
jgi:tripartite-type tricarboxylate transporter receptor subunit TctC